jgi:hypothetical protein
MIKMAKKKAIKPAVNKMMANMPPMMNPVSVKKTKKSKKC